MKTSAAFCRVSAFRHVLGSPFLALLISVLVSPLAHGQQWRAAERAPLMAQNAERADSAERQENRAELRRERKMQWLKSANGSVNGTGNSAAEPNDLNDPNAARGRMGGMSREDRHRLRSDIREAGFSAYSAEGNRRRP